MDAWIKGTNVKNREKFLFLIILLVGNLFGETPTDKSNSIHEYEKMFQASGLVNLSQDDKLKVIKLLETTIKAFNNANRRETDLSKSVSLYFSMKGYKPYHVIMHRTIEKDWIIADDGILTYATSDLPISFPSLLFVDGYYYCKPNPFGGFSSIISNGDEYEFYLSNWKNLR